MARIFTAEQQQQGIALRFGALACLPAMHLGTETKPARRSTANTGRPVERI